MATLAKLLGLLGALVVAACTPNELGHIRAKKVGDLRAGPAPQSDYDGELAACGPGGWTTAGEVRLDRAPYLQQVTDRTAAIVWTVTTLDEPSIEVSSAEDGAVIAAEVEVDGSARVVEGAQIVARIAGLKPDTVYCYQVSDASGKLYNGVGFRTAPAAQKQLSRAGSGADGDTVRFVAIGDLGKQSSDQFAVKAQMQTVRYHFGLITGDIAYDEGEMHSLENNFFSVYTDIIDRVPFFPASGNHDYRTNRAGPYREAFVLPENGQDELYYSFEWGPIHVAIIDTENLSSEQVAWLDRDLTDNTLPWKIVVGHRPPYSSGYHGSDGDVRKTFEPIFQRHGVQLGLFGHDHNYERTQSVDGVTYIVTGGGGIGTRPVGSSSFAAHTNRVAHFVYGEVSANAMTLWAIDGTGQTFDTVVISAD